MSTRHFVTVWNPTYARSAIESHLELLLLHARHARNRGGGPDDDENVYVWWGKVRSQHRLQPLPHLPEILATLTREDTDDEQHLYLTDYRSLYVAHVTDIVTDDPREFDASHVPDYYVTQRLNCDCWFELDDVRRLVVDDTVAVVEALQRLRNTRYHDRPVSIYGGMVELPLIVTRDTEQLHFTSESRDPVTNGTRWVEFDAERTGTGAMERDLRENLIGEPVWRRLDPAVHTFCATAEAIFRRNRDDAAFDFSPVVMDLAKAIEVQTHHALRRLLARAPTRLKCVRVNGETVDITRRHLSLGEIPHALRDPSVRQWVAEKGGNAVWFANVFPAVAEELAHARNDAAHEKWVGIDRALPFRNRVLGIGCEGDLVKLAMAAG